MAVAGQLAFLRLDGDAGVVADALTEAGEGVEKSGLAGVRIADELRRSTCVSIGNSCRRSVPVLRAPLAKRCGQEFVDFNPRDILAAERQPCRSQANFHRVAERGKADNLDLLALEHAQFGQPLHNRVVALQRQDAPRWPGRSWSRVGTDSLRHGPDENLASAHSPRQAQPATADVEQTGTSGLNNLNVRAADRMPSSASRPIQDGSPVTAWTSPHSPGPSSSSGISGIKTPPRGGWRAIEIQSH